MNDQASPKLKHRKYLLSPGTMITSVKIKNQSSGYFEVNDKRVNSVEATGGSKNSAPTAIWFKVYNTSDYSTAHITLEYYQTEKSINTKTADCDITFKLSGEKWWEQQGSTILPHSGTDYNLPIVPPTRSSGAGPETLNKKMVYLLDVSPQGNLLFRGNSPLAGYDKRINFETLHTYMKEQYEFQARGVTNPKAFPPQGEYVLCEIALLSPSSETDEIAYSVASYGSKSTQKKLLKEIADGHAGKVVDLVSGSTPYPENPVTHPTQTNKQTVYGQMYLWPVEPGYDTYDLKHAERLYDMVNTKSTFKVGEKILPIIYYIHCCNGRDRTGIMSSIYMIEKSNSASPSTNSNDNLTDQYIRGTTLNLLPTIETGPQLYTKCVYYNGPNKNKKAPNQSRCFMIHAQIHPNYTYRKTVEKAYNSIKGNQGSDSQKSINKNAEQGHADVCVYVMDDPSVVPSTK